MSKRHMGGAAAGIVFALVVCTGGALAPAATGPAFEAVGKAAGVPYVQADKGPEPVFWSGICRILRICG